LLHSLPSSAYLEETVKNKHNIKWIKSERFERGAEFDLPAGPEKIFPLLCPVLEYDWLPGWKCEMCHSKSGVAEKDAVFHTKEAMGRRMVWTLITYEPDRFVEYIMVSGKDAVIRLSITLEEREHGVTRVTWRMLFTLTSVVGRLHVARAFSPSNYARFVEKRRQELECFLKTGTMYRLGA